MDSRLIALALGTFAIGTDSFVAAGLLPEIAVSLDVSLAAAGQLITVYTFAYALMTPVMATLTAHWPRKRVLIVALGVFVAGNILTATVATFDAVLVSRAVAGLGGAMLTPAASAAAAGLVAPERRGRALAVVMAGLSGATALGAPIGTLIASFGDWRLTMWFVAALGALAALGVSAALPDIPSPPALRLPERLAPLADVRVAVTLATTFLVTCGLYVVYAYISAVFDDATGGDGAVLAVLLSIWGVAATIGNLGAGSLTDRFGSRRTINLAIAVVVIDFLLMPWGSAALSGTILALAMWGLCGWGFFVPQQHRLIGIAPRLAPILLALNGATVYFAASTSSAIGALAMGIVDPRNLPLVGAILLLAALLTAELSHRLVHESHPGVGLSLPAVDTGQLPE